MNSAPTNPDMIPGTAVREAQYQTLVLLQELKSGQLNPETLTSSDRRQLVAFLVAEGQSTAEIAHLFQTSDRTIERDRKALREANSIAKDPKLTAQMAGKLCLEAELCIQRIRKYQRDPDASAAVKVDAEHRCFQICAHMIEKLQSMGYVESVTQRIEADVSCHLSSIESLDEIAQETSRLKQIAGMISNSDSLENNTDADMTVSESGGS